MLGVEVRDVDAVWRRLRDLEHGQEEDDGQEILGDVTTVDCRRSVCFVDLAGHCWEAWQRWEQGRRRVEVQNEIDLGRVVGERGDRGQGPMDR